MITIENPDNSVLNTNVYFEGQTGDGNSFRPEGLSSYYDNDCRYNLSDAIDHLRELQAKRSYKKIYVARITTITQLAAN